jgi:RNA polymerase primary sigma factor
MFGFDDQPAMKMEEIGEHFGLTRERVRQIKDRALSQLRGIINKDDLRENLM